MLILSYHALKISHQICASSNCDRYCMEESSRAFPAFVHVCFETNANMDQCRFCVWNQPRSFHLLLPAVLADRSSTDPDLRKRGGNLLAKEGKEGKEEEGGGGGGRQNCGRGLVPRRRYESSRPLQD